MRSLLEFTLKTVGLHQACLCRDEKLQITWRKYEASCDVTGNMTHKNYGPQHISLTYIEPRSYRSRVAIVKYTDMLYSVCLRKEFISLYEKDASIFYPPLLVASRTKNVISATVLVLQLKKFQNNLVPEINRYFLVY